MPGYGIAGPSEGSGLLHWSWAAERLTAARNYWVATVWPDGRPHIMPVWGMWDDSTLWFTSSAGSRKVRNLTTDPRCCITTEDASDPVIIEGTAHISTELPVLLVNHSVLSSHMAQTGMTCGRPSGQTVAIQ